MSQYRLPVAPTDHPDVVGHFQRWLAHVEAGRIGGKVRSVAAPTPNPSREREGSLEAQVTPPACGESQTLRSNSGVGQRDIGEKAR
ncbi:hypothetical protein D2V17_07305 [Aurantiacibacter xanthus]|uniref:Uncharacterized protein n=1 Tax=Aurantiacibacter xanthus TaxID=1784712 RepID=A0A3A1P9Q5_9SPHN|nr:hypothetical protein D2V17_07305 [Aurantiacibacter xanthus]